MGPSAFYVVFSILTRLVKSWVGRCWICGWWMVLTLLFIAVIVSREKADHCGTAIYAGAKFLLRQISRTSIHLIHPSSRQCIIINDTFWQVATCPSWGGALHYSCDLTMVEEHRDRYVSVEQPTTHSMLDRPEWVTKTYTVTTLWSWPSTTEGQQDGGNDQVSGRRTLGQLAVEFKHLLPPPGSATWLLRSL